MHSMTAPTRFACRMPMILCALALLLAGCGSADGPEVLLGEEIGIKTLAGFTPLISAGSRLPASFEDDFSTSADDQSAVELQLYAGGPDGNRRDLTVFVIDQIDPAPKGMPRIRVSLQVSATGKATIKAVQREKNLSKEVELGQLATRPTR